MKRTFKKIEIVYIDNEIQVREILKDDTWGNWALIYPNAHNKGTTYALRIHDAERNFQGGKFIGADFGKLEARDLALEYVIEGIIPSN